MDERLYEAAISGDVQQLHDRLNELDEDMQPVGPKLLDRVMRECSGKDNPLHLGALFGREGLVKTILTLKPEFARELNSKGQSPLHLAAERGHLQVVKVLLQADADVCFVRDQDGRIPLHLAVIKGRVEVVEELVNTKKITAWFLTNEKEPILHLCAKHEQFYALMTLVSLVKDVEFVRLKDSNDNTILHLLSANRRTEIIKFLLNNTNIAREINASNVDKLTALDELYLVRWEEGFSELKEILVGKGAERSGDQLGGRTDVSLKVYKQETKWLKRMEPSFLVLAVLVVTATYAAVLNPPGGFWSDDYPDPGSKQNHTAVLNQNPGHFRTDEYYIPDLGSKQNQTDQNPGTAWNYIFPDSKQNHTAGKSILWSKHPGRYYVFYIINSMGFWASLLIISKIVGKQETDPTDMLEFLTSSTRIVTFSLLIAYFLSLWLGGPHWFLCLLISSISSVILLIFWGLGC